MVILLANYVFSLATIITGKLFLCQKKNLWAHKNSQRPTDCLLSLIPYSPSIRWRRWRVLQWSMTAISFCFHISVQHGVLQMVVHRSRARSRDVNLRDVNCCIAVGKRGYANQASHLPLIFFFGVH